MKLNELKPAKGSKKSRKRVGRGESSGYGKFSGRGSNGQRSRSGGSLHLAFEGGQTPFFRRVPKKGFSNFPFKDFFSVINVSDLEKTYETGEVVNRETLIEKGLVRRKKLKIKLLGDGEISKKLSVFVDKVSKTAKEKVEKAKGDVTIPKVNMPEKE